MVTVTLRQFSVGTNRDQGGGEGTAFGEVVALGNHSLQLPDIASCYKKCGNLFRPAANPVKVIVSATWTPLVDAESDFRNSNAIVRVTTKRVWTRLTLTSDFDTR